VANPSFQRLARLGVALRLSTAIVHIVRKPRGNATDEFLTADFADFADGGKEIRVIGKNRETLTTAKAAFVQ